MLFHTVFVVSAFLGWEVVWNSPQRDDDSTSWGKFKRHGSQLLLGLVWAVGMAAGSAFSVLAGTDCLLVDPVTACFGDLAVPPLVCEPNAGNCS